MTGCGKVCKEAGHQLIENYYKSMLIQINNNVQVTVTVVCVLQ